ncbi:MAG: GNAT family N-acetyltransferase [Limnoraphis sp.]
MSDLEIKIVHYAEAVTEIRTIRHQVFTVEQGVESTLEFDGDDTAQHLLAYLNYQPVGTARIRYLSPQTAKIERLAVLSTARGRGIGRELMQVALEVIASKKVEETVVHAQEYIKQLYHNLGFEQVGERFDEAGISHVKMIKKMSV